MPTQVVGTLEDVYRWDNLYAAWRAASKGKRSHQPAAAFEFRLEDNLIELQEELFSQLGGAIRWFLQVGSIRSKQCAA